jgi:hypothetical protein
MKAALVLLAVALSGCAAGTDRHGRPIDGWKPVTRDTSPDPGKRPTVEEAVEAIAATPPDAKATLVVRSMREATYIAPLGQVVSGWLVCYRATGENFFGKVVSTDRGAVLAAKDIGFFVNKGFRNAEEMCRMG